MMGPQAPSHVWSSYWWPVKISFCDAVNEIHTPTCKDMYTRYSLNKCIKSHLIASQLRVISASGTESLGRGVAIYTALHSAGCGTSPVTASDIKPPQLTGADSCRQLSPESALLHIIRATPCSLVTLTQLGIARHSIGSCFGASSFAAVGSLGLLI
jgi:hypothetical protein